MKQPFDLIGQLLRNDPLDKKKSFFLLNQNHFRSSGHRSFRTYYYAIVLITGNSSEFQIGSMAYTVNPGDILAIGPGEMYHCAQLESLSFDALVFNEEVFQNSEKPAFFYSLDYFCPDQDHLIRPEKGSLPGVHSLLNSIKLFGSNPVVLNGLLQSLLVFLQQLYLDEDCRAGQVPHRKSSEVSAFRELLAKNIRRQKDVSSYSSDLNMTAKRLSEILVKETGWTAKRWIEHQISVEAKSLLCYTDMPIKQVAHTLGYEDISYFTKTFKKWSGMSPAAFRTGNGQEKVPKQGSFLQ